jgi:hypothetical protein
MRLSMWFLGFNFHIICTGLEFFIYLNINILELLFWHLPQVLLLEYFIRVCVGIRIFQFSLILSS